MDITRASLESSVQRRFCATEEVYQAFQQRLREGCLTRDEQPQSHICAYFLPVHPESGDVFIVHHKKSGLWIAPGGHIDRGETILEALNREIAEELGVAQFFPQAPMSFLLTMTPIANQVQPCTMHYDLWYRMETDGSNFAIDPEEFFATQWMGVEEALRIVTDPANRAALEIVRDAQAR